MSELKKHVGWGVFAARDLEEYEIIEFAPLFLPMEHTLPVIKHSVLDDYHYSYRRGQQALSLVALGMTLFYNHDREPNVQYTSKIEKIHQLAIHTLHMLSVSLREEILPREKSYSVAME
jgi:SET domain-containing protein